MSQEGRFLSNGSIEVDVEFPTLEVSTVEPPNPVYLKVHAAFAKVLHLSGAAEYIDSVERDAEMEGTLRLNGETDFASYLRSKLVLYLTPLVDTPQSDTLDISLTSGSEDQGKQTNRP
jgi:hypothetical protein